MKCYTFCINDILVSFFLTRLLFSLKVCKSVITHINTYCEIFCEFHSLPSETMNLSMYWMKSVFWVNCYISLQWGEIVRSEN